MLLILSPDNSIKQTSNLGIQVLVFKPSCKTSMSVNLDCPHNIFYESELAHS